MKRVEARLAKIAETKDEGVYARHYVEDCKALLHLLGLMVVGDRVVPIVEDGL